MRPRIVYTIFAKEMTDTLRDRRTLVAMFVVPVLLYPLLFTVMGHITASAEKDRKSMHVTVTSMGRLPDPARAALAKEFGDAYKPREDDGATAIDSAVDKQRDDAARALVESGEADLVIVAPTDTSTRFAGDAGITLRAIFDEVKPRSQAAEERAENALKEASSTERDARLARRQLPDRFDRPFTVERRDMASKARRGGAVAGHILPFILIFVMVIGGLLPAVDVTAGEKERGTLQTLLCAPVRPVEIVAGKYVTVVILSLLGAVANLGAMGFTLHQQVSALGKDALEFDLGAAVAFKVFAAMIPCALLFSALLLAFAVFARSFREANAYLSPILMVLSFPAMVAMIPTVELGPATAFAPVVNLALLIREVLRGPVPPLLFFTVIAANCVYATMAVLLAARVFETEQVLLGGERPWRDLFGDARRAAVTPSPRQVIFFVAVLVVAAWYGALYLLRAKVSGAVALALFQAVMMLLPALLFVGASRLSFKETLLLKLPRGRAWLGMVLVASGAWGVGAVVQLVENRYFPGARAYYELMDKALGDLGSSTGLALLAVSILPAIAEETCFRGVVLQGLGNTGSRAVALFGSALIFGLFHINPYHAVGAGLLGMVFGFAALETGSLLPGVLAHMVNNGLGVLMLRWPSLGEGMQRPWLFVVACVVTGVGLVLMRGTRAPAESERSKVPAVG